MWTKPLAGAGIFHPVEPDAASAPTIGMHGVDVPRPNNFRRHRQDQSLARGLGGRALGPFSAWLGVMVWVCESCCGAVCFGPWEGDVEVGEDESLDGGEPVEDESARGVGGV